MKHCVKCKESKEITLFGNNAKSTDGHSAWCKACHVKSASLWNKQNKDKYNSHKRTSGKKTYRTTGKALSLRWKHGLSLEDYNKMLKEQNGVCAICSRPEWMTVKGTLRQLAVDHRHITNKIRALLCGSCNKALGLLQENPIVIQSMLNYINKHNTEVL
jgi:Recombination endonuclease VII